HSRARHSFPTRRSSDLAWKSQFISGLMHPIMMLVGNLGYIGTAVSGSILAARGAITVGDIQAFIHYVRNFTHPITQMAQVMSMRSEEHTSELQSRENLV